jgi:predicted nuclease of predicted toxin-antitoxin system
VKLFIDECLSPQLAARLNATGRYDAVHPMHVGRRGEPDHRVHAWCIAEDRVIVTENARDFRRLVGNTELHPGLIILPAIDREERGFCFRPHSPLLKIAASPWTSW